MKSAKIAIFATLLTMASTTFAATQAANVATIAPTMQVKVTVQKAVSLTLATGATAAINHCSVAAGSGADYSMDFGTVDALAINTDNCNKLAPAVPGTDNAIYWSDYQLLPVYTSHTAFSNTSVTAQVTTDFGNPHNVFVVRDTSNSNAATVTTPTTAANFTALSTSAGDPIGASGVASGTALTRFIGVAVTPINNATLTTTQQTATVTFTLTVQ